MAIIYPTIAPPFTPRVDPKGSGGVGVGLEFDKQNVATLQS